MSKYIIELDENAKKVVAISLEDGIMWTDETEVENLEELNSDYINEHFGDLQDEAYKRGFQDGKDKSGEGCKDCMWEGSPYDACEQCCNAYKNLWTAKEQDGSIKVGDEVRLNRFKGVVTKIVGDSFHVMWYDGLTASYEFDEKNIVKTGKNIDIKSIMKAMSEAQ